MSSHRGSNNGGGAGVQSIPPAARKIVQSLKEINKDSAESRSRSGSNTSNRGARSGTDRYVGRGGSTQFSSSDSGPPHGKVAYRKENGTNPYTSSSSTAPGGSAHRTFQHPPAPSDFVADEKKASTLSRADGNLSASQPSTGYQPAWVGAHGQKSMADIVKMGKPQSKVSSTPTSSHYSGDQGSKVPDLYVEPGAAPDEWPLIEPTQASLTLGLESHTDSQPHPDQSNMLSNKINLQIHSEPDEVETEEDSSVENPDYVGSATMSSGNLQVDNPGDATLVDNMYEKIDSYQSNHHAFQSEEVEDAKTSVAAETANMHQLSIHEEDHEAAYEEDTPSVVIPDHLQVQSADCSHLSFGSFGSALTGYSDPFASRSSRGNIEETHLETDAPATGHSDTRNSEYYGDESIRAAADANLVHRTSGDAAGYDSPSAPQEELLKQEHSEVAHGNQYAFPSSSTGYTFESAQQLNGMNASYNYSQTSAQMQNLPFSSSMASLPNTLLAANVHPARESELPYSPFPMSQSVPNKYGNTVSSISGSSISVAEALKTGFQSVQSTQQTPSGTSVATGPALPQHLVHPYSQPTLPLGPFANMISYPFLPQSYTYMPSGFQQAFAGNNTYHQSLAAVLPQYKSSASVSNLPQSAAVPSGYGAFGSSTAIPANYAMNPTAASPAGSTMGYDDILSSQYKDSNHLISLQQNDNPGMWLHGPGSRTMSAVPASTYYSFQGQNQQPGGYRQGQQPSQNYGNLGYPNFYHSQTGVPLEHQPQNPRDGALSGSQGQPKQSQQIWQNGY
uniref:GBF-interacting protein 1 N-terminal domain-containing protein n=1 Tax=Daucus carota subsp. sativus TaxID=79200 RepID=A0A166EWR8_DAUCS